MENITNHMQDDHRRCDTIFANAEKLISDGNWSEGAKEFQLFQDAMQHHFAMEEDVIFPAFEQKTGMTMGPTQVMRSEHVQMRDIFSDMKEAVQQQNQDDYLGLSETLLIIMQQHNVKEESMLYPMADQELAGDLDEVFQKMNAV